MSTSTEVEQSDWDWRCLCQDFLFECHVPALEKIISQQYGDNTKKFISEYLEPVLALLRDVRQSAEEYFSGIEGPDDSWMPYYEKFVQSIIQISKLTISLHKGDFYVHLSSIVPGQLIMKYYDTKQVLSLPLDKNDFPKVWSKDWTEHLRNEMNGRFLFLNCIVTSKTKRLERRPWRYIMSATRNVSFKQYREIEKADSLEESCKVSRQSLFLEKPLNIFEISFELLHTGVACLPGTKDKENGHILLINPSRPDWNNIQYSTVELTRLLMYFHTLPKKQEPNIGFTVILDARKTSTKRRLLEDIIEAMICFQESCPGAIHIVYVVTKKDSPLLMFSTTKIKDQLNFEFKIITTVQELKKYIDESQLTPEFQGTFNYDHDEWIRFRIKLEPFMTGCRSAAKLAMEVMQQFTNTKVGETLQECKTLVEQHEQKVKEVFLDSRLSALQVEGEQLLIRLEEEKSNLNETEDFHETVQCVSKLYNQMNEVFCKLEMLTDNRTKRLKQCLQLREFETDSERVTKWIKAEAEPFLDKPWDLGDSLRHLETLQEEFNKFDETAKQYYDKIENLLEEGRSLYQGGHFESVGLHESCKYLEEMYKKTSKKHEDRRKQLMMGREFHQLVNEISEWTISTLKQIALMKMEEILTLEGVVTLTKGLDDYLDISPVWPASRLHRISEIATNIGQSNIISQAEGALTRYKEVEDMLEQRKSTLGRAEERLKGHPSCEISSTTTGGSDESSSTPQDGDIESDGAPDTDDELDSPLPEAVQAFITPERKISSEKLYTWKEPLESVEEREQNLSPRVKEKLTYIVQEMIDTERDYVKSLEYIIQNYLSRLEDPDLLPSLRGKKNILFGNIERIYDFHNRCFLRELEICQDRPLQIGSCFLKWERQFYLYALYNKNKPRSDQLLSDHGNAFFRTCQKELGDKLDLGSYLMKPVQRMCKYGLLLRDMIDTCKDGSRVNELEDAVNMVRFQLRHGNDLLAMDSLRNCDVNVKEQGRLLRQDNFIVWTGKKKHQRRVFLFEDLVLFSKAKRQIGGVDLFCYKNSLKTADLGLTETVGDGGLKFELWFRKRRTGEKFILQASNMKVKTAWLMEITKILWKQAVRNKEYGLTEASTGISVESQPALHIPTTRYDEPPPYQPTITSNVVLRATSSPTTVTDKRLSLIGSEFSDSSASSGFCDVNAHLTEDDTASSRGTTVSPDSRVSSTKQQTSPRNRRRRKSAEEPSNKVTKDIDKSQTDKRHKTSKSPTPEEEKKSTNFFRSFSLRDRSHSDKTSERSLSPGEEGSTSGVVLRRNGKDSNNGSSKRRSLIDRITHKHSETSKEKDKQRRRSLGETSLTGVDIRTEESSPRPHKTIAKSKSTCLATEV